MKFSQPSKVAFVDREYANSFSSSAHRNQSVVGQPTTPDLFVAVPGSQPRQNLTGACPIGEIWHENAVESFNIALKPLDQNPLPPGSTKIKLLKHNGANPYRQPAR